MVSQLLSTSAVASFQRGAAHPPRQRVDSARMGHSSTTTATQVTTVITFPTLLTKNLPNRSRLLLPAVLHFRSPRPDDNHSGGKLPTGLDTLARRAARVAASSIPTVLVESAASSYASLPVCHPTSTPPRPLPEAVASWHLYDSPSMYLACHRRPSQRRPTCLPASALHCAPTPATSCSALHEVALRLSSSFSTTSGEQHRHGVLAHATSARSISRRSACRHSWLSRSPHPCLCCHDTRGLVSGSDC
jgi:hypothetical protein